MSARTPAAFAAVLMLPLAAARAEPEMLFPPATAGCYVGTEIAPAPGIEPYRNPRLPVTAIRLERSYPQLAQEEKQPPRTDGARLINLRVIAS